MEAGVALPEIAAALNIREFFIWKVGIGRRELTEKQCGVLIALAKREGLSEETLEMLRELERHTKSELQVEASSFNKGYG